MSTVKVIYRQKPVLPIFLHTAFFCWGNYELYRIYQGTHPTISAHLEKAGIYSAKNTNAKEADEKKSEDKRIGPSEQGDEGEERWTRMNGVPIPTFEMLMRPFRKD